MSKHPRRRLERRGQIETLEAREVMSADPIGNLLSGAISHHAIQEDEPLLTQHDVPQLDHHTLGAPDFWLDEGPQPTLEEQLDQIEKSLASAHQQTGMDQVKIDYGFSGVGQTVAVIDSGIAYDHYALGGGLGGNYRVVGGWDFTENDADPYDDGTEGSHGTHVSGIVGADDGGRSGVAPGVDLVGLRVFSDSGAGYFSWVESALQWVHANRNNYENPITAVNLSLGTNWNSSSTPAWAMLEDEFAQLKADGIFISVSAGNSFTDYNTPGLSYPAASSHVVPVMSSDDSGFLSYFSQRHSRAIAAPGRYIYSTVPDYAGNHNNVTDDWANFSGTSMAAPYVAGASVIIREAMEFVGYTGITQDTIYDHMIDTADTVYDSNTGAYYNRLNVQAAIDALMPEDDFGDSIADAYELGVVNAGIQSQSAAMNGAITKLSDSDYFTFTAGATGTVTFTASNTTHHMAATWNGMGADGWVSEDGASYTLNVVGGQEYCIALASDDGLGYYDLGVSAESAFTYTDWGAAGVQETKSGLNAGAEAYYRIVAGQYGYFTAEAQYDSGTVSFDIVNANLEVLASGSGDRADYYAQAGEELYLRVSGAASGVDFRLTNAVSVAGNMATVLGTSGDDAFTFAAGATHVASLNSVSYTFDSAAVAAVNFEGGEGYDTAEITGSSGADAATIRFGQASLVGVGYQASAIDAEDVTVNGGGGADVVNLYDTAGVDHLIAYSDRVEMVGEGYTHKAVGFVETYGYSNSGGDSAYMHDSADNDLYRTYEDRVVMSGDGYYNRATGFSYTYGYASTGVDASYMYDTTGDDLYRTYDDRVVMSGDGYYNRAHGFDTTYGYSTQGNDSTEMYGSAGVDHYRAFGDHVEMKGDGFFNLAEGFARTYGYASGVDDWAYMYDTAGDDHYRTYGDRVEMTGDGYFNRASGFNFTYGYASGGADHAYMYDTVGNDLYRTYEDRVVMSGAGYYNRATGFEYTYGYSSQGVDSVRMYDTAGNDLYRTYSDRVVMSGVGYYNRATGFDTSYAYSTSGIDSAEMYGSDGVEHYRAYADHVEMKGDGFFNLAGGFAQTYGYATGAEDAAYMYDSAGNDHYRTFSNKVEMVGAGYFNQAIGYSQTYGYSSGGVDSAYMYDSAGADLYRSYSDRAVMSGTGYYNRATGFVNYYAYASTGVDTALLYGSENADLYRAYSDRSVMTHSGYHSRATGFDIAAGYGDSADSAVIEDSSADDYLWAQDGLARITYGASNTAEAAGFGSVTGKAVNGGTDTLDENATDFVFDEIGVWS